MTKLENESQYQWAVARVEQLLPKVNDTTPTDNPDYIELVVLSNLVADYDEEHYPIGIPSLIDVLKLRMYELGLNQNALAKLIGVTPSRVCEYLTGKKEPTLKVARTISAKLSIDPAIVLGA